MAVEIVFRGVSIEYALRQQKATSWCSFTNDNAKISKATLRFHLKVMSRENLYIESIDINYRSISLLGKIIWIDRS